MGWLSFQGDLRAFLAGTKRLRMLFHSPRSSVSQRPRTPESPVPNTSPRLPCTSAVVPQCLLWDSYCLPCFHSKLKIYAKKNVFFPKMQSKLIILECTVSPVFEFFAYVFPLYWKRKSRKTLPLSRPLPDTPSLFLQSKFPAPWP